MEMGREGFRNGFSPLDSCLRDGTWGPTSLEGRNKLSCPWHSESRGGLGRRKAIQGGRKVQGNGCFRWAWPCSQFLWAQRLSEATLSPGAGGGHSRTAPGCIAREPSSPFQHSMHCSEPVKTQGSATLIPRLTSLLWAKQSHTCQHTLPAEEKNLGAQQPPRSPLDRGQTSQKETVTAASCPDKKSRECSAAVAERGFL